MDWGRRGSWRNDENLDLKQDAWLNSLVLKLQTCSILEVTTQIFQ